MSDPRIHLTVALLLLFAAGALSAFGAVTQASQIESPRPFYWIAAACFVAGVLHASQLW